MYIIPKLPISTDLETIEILKQVNRANKQLAELKGISHTIPNENILINTLTLQEAKDSSAVENIITTHDELYKADLDMRNFTISSSTKEVLYYSEALKRGFSLIRNTKILSLSNIKEIQEILEQNKAGFRSIPGTNLLNNRKEVVYTPPQNKLEIDDYMRNLEQFINDETASNLDPLIKMAIIHHQFESIHPFYDGNGRTGRIINILFLVINDLLDLPILYLSRYIIDNKQEYYRLLQSVRDNGNWEEWVMFMLKGVEVTAKETIELVKQIRDMMQAYKLKMRPIFGKRYKHELLNNLFNHPYTKIEFVEKDLGISRLTATSYLNTLTEHGLVTKLKIGRSNYYLNDPLTKLLMNYNHSTDTSNDSIESVNMEGNVQKHE